MTKPINVESIEKATNKNWKQWVQELDDDGARQISHKDLALRLYKQLDGTIENHGWWAQGITVAYEQHTGKRVPGQLANGLFEFAVSKTVEKSRDDLFKQVVAWFDGHTELNGSDPLRPRSSQTPKRSNWRCDFGDGSKFSATVEGGDKKSKLVLAHTALPNKKEADNWKTFWTKTIKVFADNR